MSNTDNIIIEYTTLFKRNYYDLISLLTRQKKASIFYVPFVKLEEATEFFKKYGFEVESSEQLINISETNYEVTKNRTVTSKFSLYVSRYKKISSRLKELDYKQKKHIGDGVEITRKIGEILGYPSCCINYYVKMSHIYGKKFNDQSIYFENIFRLSPYESSVKKNFLLNNFVNYGYINFFVCDYNCIKAIEIAKENRSLLEKFIDVNGHDDKLKNPILYFSYLKYITYKRIVMRGRRMYYYQPRISDNSLNCFHYGNNFLIEKNMVKIYYDSELLEELPRKQKLSGHLICLSEL